MNRNVAEALILHEYMKDLNELSSYFDLKVLDNLYKQADIFIKKDCPNYLSIGKKDTYGRALKPETNQKLTEKYK